MQFCQFLRMRKKKAKTVITVKNKIVGVLEVKFLIVLFFLEINIPSAEVPDSNNATTKKIKAIVIILILDIPND